MMHALSSTALVLLVTGAAASDLRTRRIPNVLTMSALGAALALRSFDGADAFWAGLQGAGLAMLLVVPLVALGALGGGDLKLLMAVGGFLGPQGLLIALLATSVTGGVLALAEVTRKGVVLPTLFNAVNLAKYGATLGRLGSRSTLSTQGAVSIPYGVAIAVGTLAAWFLPLAEWVR